ncbi:MAG: DsrE family protein [Deltaproteobacteria bacterium]|nr:DsrE family protein [Deltaproteobacteria bacterium]
MEIAILLKSGPRTDEARRALQTAGDMLLRDHNVHLCLLQEAVRFCSPGTKCSSSMDLQELIEKNLQVHILICDTELRGIPGPCGTRGVSEESYESLIDLMVSCDRVIGIL